ncbi:MAG: aldehyde dehydrogenase family protein [Chloroflexi bacterium]|nr:MAG: aldehyde dehydrogenase family protein [Chloroflexota bacterium]
MSTVVSDEKAATKTTPREYKQFIGGNWVTAANSATYDDHDPYSGATVARIPASTRDDARRAVEAAANAFQDWWKTPPGEKQRLFLKAADILERRQMEVVGLLAAETGCTFGFGMFQTIFTPNLLRQAASLPYHPTGEILPADLPGAFYMAMRQPVGVVAGLAPWNAPLILSLRAIAAPLALGNTVVLKPSEESPITGGILYAEIFEEAGFPQGTVNVVTHAPGQAEPVVDEFMENPKVRRISFTGSTKTGRILAQKAAPYLKRMVLELGGQNPLIVLADAELEYAVNATAFGTFLHQGQICMSARRIIVERSIAKEFTDRLVAKTKGLKVGSPTEPDTIIGPLINKQAVEQVKARVDEAVAHGAKVLTGGHAQGACYEPTLLTDVPDDVQMSKEETFGPVATITIVDSADEAVDVANRTSYGLAAGILTRNADRALSLAERIQSGIVHINDQPVNDEPQVPFGGVKDSGYGRFGGSEAVHEFTEMRWVTVQSLGRAFPF